jgi:GDP-L-fucose synthase
MLNKDSKIYIAGHNGMVGSACWQVLSNAGYNNLIGKSSKELNLKNQIEVKEFLAFEKPYAIINAAAKVGGILANDTFPYEFLMDNMLIQNNLIGSAHELEIPKFIFLGSSCIYPKLASQPLKEEYLLTGPLEPTNEWYAIAKISGIKLIEALRKQYSRDYISIMPTNLYGPMDNFDLNSSHVLPAMIRKFHEAKLNKNSTVELWGSGKPMREFLHVNDLGKAVLFVLENKLNFGLYNVGTGNDLKIKELAHIVQKIINHTGKIKWNLSKPDGTPRKLMNIERLKNEGWTHKIDLLGGIEKTYSWFLENNSIIKKISL